MNSKCSLNPEYSLKNLMTKYLATLHFNPNRSRFAYIFATDLQQIRNRFAYIFALDSLSI